MNAFLTSNEWQWRLLRTIVRGVLGVIVANVDMLIGCAVLEPTWRAVVVALVMAVLSPLMAELGAATAGKGGRTMSAEFLEVERVVEAMREPTDEQLLAIEAARCEGAPDDFDPQDGDAR